jgi:hypothetical protein
MSFAVILLYCQVSLEKKLFDKPSNLCLREKD